ncbi:MAG: hypothetical protein R2932_33480 [Caldilineaceae bacterium]
MQGTSTSTTAAAQVDRRWPERTSTEATTLEPLPTVAGEADPEIRATSEYVLEHIDDEMLLVLCAAPVNTPAPT